jgi:hypothetical protein
MSLNEKEEQAVQAVYDRAFQLKNQGKSSTQIKDALVSEGLDNESAKIVVNNMNQAITEQKRNESSGVGGWVIWIGLLLLINLLSWIFDWPFWIY